MKLYTQTNRYSERKQQQIAKKISNDT